MKSVVLYSFIIMATTPVLLSCQKKSREDHNDHSAHKEDTASQLFVVPAESTNRTVISSQSVVKLERQRQASPVSAYGFLALDERRSNQVAARVSGRIEKLYVKFENQYVRKGEKILDLYSVDLNTYQEELLYAQKIDPDGELPKHAAHKLKLLGVTDSQIKNILSKGETDFTLSIYSPYNGYIFYSPFSQSVPTKGTMAAGGSGRMGRGMTAASSEKRPGSVPMASSGGPVREGAYVAAGQPLFWINDLREVWGILSVDNLHQDRVSLKDSVEVVSELMPRQPFHTIVQFIEPQYALGQKFIQVRVYLPNTGNALRINSLLEASIHPKPGDVQTIPASSILYLGGRQAVWKKTGETSQGNHIFEIQFVTLGPVSQGRVSILNGLMPDDEVALDAGFLMDRESLVKPE